MSPSELSQLRLSINNFKDTIMTTLDDLKAEVPETAKVVDGLIAVVNAQSALILGLQTQLDMAIAESAANPVAFASIQADLDAIQKRAAAVIAANAPPPDPAPAA